MLLKKYQKFLLSFPESEQRIFHLGTITERYFYLSQYQADEFKEELGRVFDPSNKNTVSSGRLYAFCFGFYALIKVALEATYKLNQYFSQKKNNSSSLRKYRDSWSQRIKPVSDIANDIVKHPLDDSKRGKDYFFEPCGSDSAGSVTIYKWWMDPEKECDFLIIKPAKDLRTVYDYLEGLADQYLTIQG